MNFRKAFNMWFQLNVNEIRCQPVDGNGNPIAGHAPYEEYDHKTQPRQAEDWIGISASDASQTSKSHSRRGPNRRDNARGHSKIEYDNDDFDPTKLLSLYRNSSWKSSQSGMSGETSGAIHNSLLSEIENSSYAATQRGFREDFVSSFKIFKAILIMSCILYIRTNLN